MQAIANGRGGDCVSEEYKNSTSKLLWKCKEGHVWAAIPAAIRKGHWCPYCKHGVGERITRTYFEQLFKAKFPSARHGWLKDPETGRALELDGYCESLAIAFEHQGLQHYEKSDYFSKEKVTHRKLVKRDRFKAKRCRDAKIRLFVIPEVPSLTPLPSLIEVIKSEAKRLRMSLPRDIDKIRVDLTGAYAPTARDWMKELVEECEKRGGKCLDEVYLGQNIYLSFVCSNGHEWSAKPANIFSGRWCRKCADQRNGLNRRSSLEDVKFKAKERGLEYISGKYQGMHHKLLFRCIKNGHEFLAKPSNIIWAQKGCGYCSKNKKYTIEFMREVAASRKGKCLSKVYKGARERLLWECEKRHRWRAIPSTIVSRNSWCEDCYHEWKKGKSTGSKWKK